jgi:hypothetical protein
MANNKNPAININLIPPADRAVFDTLSEQGQAEFFGFGKGTRKNIDVPQYITVTSYRAMADRKTLTVLQLILLQEDWDTEHAEETIKADSIMWIQTLSWMLREFISHRKQT